MPEITPLIEQLRLNYGATMRNNFGGTKLLKYAVHKSNRGGGHSRATKKSDGKFVIEMTALLLKIMSGVIVLQILWDIII